MADPTYSIVIPTRERVDVLPASIQSVLAQTCEDWELVVMDNCSEDETKTLAEKYSDPRVRFIRGETRLPMSENWERGISHARGKYVTVLGDDDALLPDAIEWAQALHRNNPGALLAWKAAVWFWPEFIVPPWRNLLKSNLADLVEVVGGREILERFYQFETDFHHLPGIYSSFVPAELIEKLRAKHGRYFLSPIPDIYTGIVNALHADPFLFSWRPLSVWGQSHHSTGSSYGFRHFSDRSAARFDAEHRTEWSEGIDPLVHFEGKPLLEAVIWSAMTSAKELYFPDDKELAMPIAGAVRNLCNALHRYPYAYDELVEKVHAFAAKHGVSPSDYAIPPKGTGPAPLPPAYAIDETRRIVSFNAYTTPKFMATVDQVAESLALALPPVAALRFGSEGEVAARGADPEEGRSDGFITELAMIQELVPFLSASGFVDRGVTAPALLAGLGAFGLQPASTLDANGLPRDGTGQSIGLLALGWHQRKLARNKDLGERAITLCEFRISTPESAKEVLEMANSLPDTRTISISRCGRGVETIILGAVPYELHSFGTLLFVAKDVYDKALPGLQKVTCEHMWQQCQRLMKKYCDIGIGESYKSAVPQTPQPASFRARVARALQAKGPSPK